MFTPETVRKAHIISMKTQAVPLPCFLSASEISGHDSFRKNTFQSFTQTAKIRFVMICCREMRARREVLGLLWLLVLVGKCSPFQVSPHAFKTLRSQPHATSPPSLSLLSSCSRIGRSRDVAGSLSATVGRAPGSLSRNSRTRASSRINLTMNKDAIATFVDGLLCQRSVQV
jgi:hypothetical protein